ncbi:hypothetical protein PG996_011107 [Apiospora saccharicola]|uniref:Uncharacterized protein n=1 Tax=Apiospora saccharicola TaxID=335842 RepID=A0ABR1UGG4_9PEZI
MAVRDSLILSLYVVVVFAASIPDTDKVGAPEDGSSGQQQMLTWQSAFWAVVSIALGAATQPSGSIVGMPREWGFALKCSPAMCLFNALEVFSCIKIERREPGWRLAFRSAKYTGAPNPRRLETSADQHAVRGLETNTSLRLATFILGPLLQAVKLFACSGVLCTKLLAGCYLGSFLSDELALNFIWLSGAEGHHQATPNSLVTSVLSMFGYSRNQEDETMASDQSTTSESPDLLRIPAKLALDLSITIISWFTCSLVYLFLSIEPNLYGWFSAICILGVGPIYGIITAVKRVWRDGFSLRLAWNLTFKGSIYCNILNLCINGLENGQEIVSKEGSLRRLYGPGTPFLAWSAQGFGTLLIASGINIAGVKFFDVWDHSNLSPPPPAETAPPVFYPTIGYELLADFVRDTTGRDIRSPARPAPVRVWGILFPGAWCLLHFLTALLLYYLLFDASRTVKPGWTEVLG